MVPLTITSVAKAQPCEGRRPRGFEIRLECAGSKSHSNAITNQAALQGVGGGGHGDGYDLALCNTNLVRPIGIVVGRAGVSGQQAGSAPRRARRSGVYECNRGPRPAESRQTPKRGALHNPTRRPTRDLPPPLARMCCWGKVRPPDWSPRAEPCGPYRRSTPAWARMGTSHVVMQRGRTVWASASKDSLLPNQLNSRPVAAGLENGAK